MFWDQLQNCLLYITQQKPNKLTLGVCFDYRCLLLYDYYNCKSLHYSNGAIFYLYISSKETSSSDGFIESYDTFQRQSGMIKRNTYDIAISNGLKVELIM